MDKRLNVELELHCTALACHRHGITSQQRLGRQLLGLLDASAVTTKLKAILYNCNAQLVMLSVFPTGALSTERPM